MVILSSTNSDRDKIMSFAACVVVWVNLSTAGPIMVHLGLPNPANEGAVLVQN